jgi:hypothetical protein
VNQAPVFSADYYKIHNSDSALSENFESLLGTEKSDNFEWPSNIVRGGVARDFRLYLRVS